ncbi:DUF881 domain-containing protein [Pedococcus sp. 5OH_020]|uniref:DUF881 domain-containing protein n=1 Tax=Pedococcus sp. 5OH_020 TaxID=2989814 RepID=UPI0022EA032A|nr:DUF881 domain-containing protein [Pedococcus sp. 5OH_020]
MSTTSSSSSWATLLRMARPRATRANVFGALLAILLGFAIATQVQQTNQSGLEQLREDELIRILDDVTQEQGRVSSDIRQLEASRDRLLSGVDSSSEALKSAQERLDTLGILTGTAPATGPGVVITITDPGHKVTAARLLDALQELRDSGAEAVQMGDQRVVADTWFSDADGGITVSGHQIAEPYVIKAIGDSATMASAMDIPGGVTDSVRRDGAQSTVRQLKRVDITALHSLEEPRYARPVPAPTK